MKVITVGLYTGVLRMLMLSLPSTESVVLTGEASFGAGSGPVFIESLSCDRNEATILSCSEVNLRRESCTHDQDVSLQCIG